VNLQLLQLKPLVAARSAWPTVMAFDPRESRDHIAAAICCHRPYTYLPRHPADILGTTSVALVDLRSRSTTRSISSIAGRTFRTCRLQYVGDGDIILIMTSAFSSDNITSDVSECAAVLLSPDNLSPVYILPFCNTRQRTLSELEWSPLASRFDMATLLSDDFRKLVLVWSDANRKQRRDVIVSRDAMLNISSDGCNVHRDSREFAGNVHFISSCINDNNNRTRSYAADSSVNQSTCNNLDMCTDCWPLVAAIFHVPSRRLNALSLSQICTAVIVQLVPSARLSELPVPTLLLNMQEWSCKRSRRILSP